MTCRCPGCVGLAAGCRCCLSNSIVTPDPDDDDRTAAIALHMDPATADFLSLKLALEIVRQAQKSMSIDDPHYLAYLDGAELQLGAALDYLNPGWDEDEEEPE